MNKVLVIGQNKDRTDKGECMIQIFNLQPEKKYYTCSFSTCRGENC